MAESVMVSVPSLYNKHREWALLLAKELDDSDEGRLTALVSVWRCAREWDGEGRFRDFAGPMIEAALKRTAVET